MIRRKMKLLAAAGLALVLTLVLTGGAVAAKPAEMVKVLIGFNRQPGPAEQALVRGAGGAIKYTYRLIPTIAATVPEAAIKGLRANPNVTHVDLDGRVWAIDTELDDSWGVKGIGAGAVHAYNKGTGVKVAVIDTGIDYNHEDLDANYKGGYDFVNTDTDPMDDNGHGTHVAGTIAAEDNDTGVVGVAPEAALYALKVLDETGGGYWSDVIRALEWSVNNGMQVINMSLGGTGSTDVEAASQAAYDAGLLLVAAAGNSGNPPGRGDNIIKPAGYASVIAVGATNLNDDRAKWSSTGPDLELMAPGVDINSTLFGGGYGEKNGTSMASPHVAGTGALVIASGITDANADGFINDDVRLRLQETADDLGPTGFDTKYGYGLVDANEAAPAPSGPVNDPPTVSITSPADGATFDSGATILFEGTASDSEDEDLTASLVWTSDIVGQIGTGGSFSTTLSDGNHTITASVTDTGGKTGSASISITVGTPTTATTVKVDSITYTTEGGKDKDKHLLITVALMDDLGNPVAGASVSIELDTTTGQSWTGTGTTGTDGTVTFSLKNAPLGTYTMKVTSVTAEGLDWNGVTPDNSFEKV